MRKIKKLLMITLAALTLAMVCPSIMPGYGVTNVEAAAKINKKKITLNKGHKYTLKITGTKKKVKWSSSKKSVATVSSTGKVTARKKGTAIITGKVGTKKYTCTVKVIADTVKVKAKTLGMSQKEYDLVVGQKTLISITCTPKAATKNIKWRSDRSANASVDQNGYVTGRKAGYAIIYAEVDGLSATCQIRVIDKSAYTPKKTLSCLSIPGSYINSWTYSDKFCTIDVDSVTAKLKSYRNLGGTYYEYKYNTTISGSVPKYMAGETVEINMDYAVYPGQSKGSISPKSLKFTVQSDGSFSGTRTLTFTKRPYSLNILSIYIK